MLVCAHQSFHRPSNLTTNLLKEGPLTKDIGTLIEEATQLLEDDRVLYLIRWLQQIASLFRGGRGSVHKL